MGTKKGRKNNPGANVRCDCGHQKLVHGTGLAMYGSTNFDCAMAGCPCKTFREYQEPEEQTPAVLKTLDSPEPKIFNAG